jgi:hypothetical protein
MLSRDSAAEHARKPLYRVTCGDIGTEPTAVEHYLRRALTVAKAWNSGTEKNSNANYSAWYFSKRSGC